LFTSRWSAIASFELFPQYTSVSAFRKPQGNSCTILYAGRTKRFSKGERADQLDDGKLIDDVSRP